MSNKSDILFESLTSRYDLKKDEKGYYYEIQKEKRYIEIELLKSLFSPVDTTWEEVFAPNKPAKTTLSRKK